MCLVQCTYVVCGVCCVRCVVWCVVQCGAVCCTGVDLYLLSVSRFDLQSEVNEKLLEFKLDIGPSSAGRAVQMAANEQ